MKITKKEKRMILVSLILIIAVAVYFLIVTPIHENNKLTKEEYEQVNSQYAIIKSQIIDDKDMDKLISAYRAKIKSLESQLPSVIHLEQIIDLMFNQFENNEIIINSITFSMNDRKEEVVDDGLMGIEKLQGPMSVEEILDEYENSNKINIPMNFAGEVIEEIDYNNISYLSINMSFTGNYNNLKSVLEDLELLDITAVTTDINISKKETDDEDIDVDNNAVNVGLSLAIPFYYDNEKDKEYIFDYSFEKGSDYIERGPFEYDVIEKEDVDDSSSSTSDNHLNIYPDFFITLHSESSDLAAQSISYYTLSNSELALNSNENERFELNITESNGKVSYQFKNALDAFPSSTATMNFIPDGEDIVVKILSSSRGISNDNASMTLVLNNSSSRKVVFHVFYDDDERPRFNLVVNKGKFEIYRN